MKKSIYLFLFTVCAMLHVTALSAQETAKFRIESTGYIPKGLTKTGVPYLFAFDSGNDNKGNVKMYDSNFEEIASFAYDYGYRVKKRIVEERKEEITNINYKHSAWSSVLNIRNAYSRIDSATATLDINDISCENVIKMWLALGSDTASYYRKEDARFYKLTSDTIFYPKNSQDYYYPEYFGEKYPKYTATYELRTSYDYDYEIDEFKKIGVIVIHEAYFDADRAYTGDWEIVSETYDTIEIEAVELDFVNANGENITTAYNKIFSQNFFNDDDKFESLVPVYIPNGTTVYSEYDRDYDGEKDERTIDTKFDIKFAVYSNGSFSHYLNNMYEIASYYKSSAEVVLFGDNKYLHLEEKINDEYYNVFYRIDKSTNNIEQVGESVRAKMSVRNEVVAIEFKEPVKEQCELIVSDATGKQYEKIFVEAGSANINYDTRALAAGIYNFTVVNKGKVVENGKIVVR